MDLRKGTLQVREEMRNHCTFSTKNLSSRVRAHACGCVCACIFAVFCYMVQVRPTMDDYHALSTSLFSLLSSLFSPESCPLSRLMTLIMLAATSELKPVVTELTLHLAEVSMNLSRLNSRIVTLESKAASQKVRL